MNISPPIYVCNVCGQSQNVYRCSRCHSAFYCSKEHQKKHWKLHKIKCHPSLEKTPLNTDSGDSSDPPIWPISSIKHSDPVAPTLLDNVQHLEGQHQVDIIPEKPAVHFNSSVADAMGSINLKSEADLHAKVEEAVDKTPPFVHRKLEGCQNEDMLKRSTLERLTQVCQYVVRDLDEYGICVVDNFMGQERGECIRRTVTSMYHSGIFIEGETMNSNSNQKSTKNIRGDKITWVDGTEKSCSDIALLISMVDSIIMSSLRIKGNGELSKHQISGRTKAMVACYPASGTHYVKHVDNPNRDGRCITTTYYINKDWDVKKDGGLLRIFPQGWASQVVDIEPVFDRVIFFWSDRRNPHEVQPAFRTRYAVTLWYFDAKERGEARLRYQRDLARNVVQNKLSDTK